MQNNKLEDISGYNVHQKLLFLNENFQYLGMKDKEIIKKFCGEAQAIDTNDATDDAEINLASNSDHKIDVVSNLHQPGLNEQDQKYVEIA